MSDPHLLRDEAWERGMSEWIPALLFLAFVVGMIAGVVIHASADRP